MRTFNSLQIVTMYAVSPFVIGWLFSNPFVYSIGVAWLSVVLYGIFSGMMVYMVHESLKEKQS